MSELIVMLDCDGVLNTPRSQKRWVNRPLAMYQTEPQPAIVYLDDRCVAEFKAFLNSVPVPYKIVMSSTWRHAIPWEFVLDTFKRYEIEISDRTPVGVHPPGNPIGREYQRGKEILAWIRDNGKKGCPLMVIDDTVVDIKPYISNLFITNVEGGWYGGNGFTEWHRKHALEKVNKQLALTERDHKNPHWKAKLHDPESW